MAGDGLGEAWDGYVEMYAFASGSNRIRIRFDRDGTSGVVIFGEGTPPPPATNANVGYPPGDWYTTTRWEELVLEGVEYRFDRATNTLTHVVVAPDMDQIWATWCGLQIPIFAAQPPLPDWIGILPPFERIQTGDGTCAYTDRRTGDRVAIDCARLLLAAPSPCDCTPDGCFVHHGWEFMIDFQVSGDQGTGHIMTYAWRALHMTRTP
jgi:hypothetical protein